MTHVTEHIVTHVTYFDTVFLYRTAAYEVNGVELKMAVS